MAAFATAEELGLFLQSEVDEDTADLMLDIASGIIRGHVGWSITSEADVEFSTQGTGSDVIWLPTRRLTDVTAVEVNGEPLTDDQYAWKSSGRVRRVGGRWPTLEQSVDVKFDHGHEDTPDDVKGVCLMLAGRIYSNPEGLRTRSWSVDGLSETETVARQSSSADAAGSVDVGPSLTGAEMNILAPYLLEGVA